MNRTKEVNNKEIDSKLSTTLSVQDKCVELEAIAADKKYKIFKGGSVIIAAPTLDKSIREGNCQLFNKQCKEVLDMSCYLIENNADFIGTIIDINTEIDECLKRLEGRELDYLICLHEIIDKEKKIIIHSLRDKTGCEVIELY